MKLTDTQTADAVGHDVMLAPDCGVDLNHGFGLGEGERGALLAQLQDASARLSELIRQLGPGAPAAAAAPAPASGPSAAPPATDVKRLLQLRAKRRRHPFGQFLDWPAWDMLLDLAAVKAEGGHVSVSAVCISSGAPQSTALRKLAALEGANLVRRYLHGADRRRVCLTLTDEAVTLVNALLLEEGRFYAERSWAAGQAFPAESAGAQPPRAVASNPRYVRA
jgi:hypothetical protein